MDTEYPLHNVEHLKTGTNLSFPGCADVDPVTFGLTKFGYLGGHAPEGDFALSPKAVDLLRELLAGNLDAPTPGWTEGDVVTFKPAHAADRRLFTLQRGADGAWAIFVDGVPGHRRSSWSDEAVDNLLDGRGAYDADRSPYANPTVVIRQAGQR